MYSLFFFFYTFLLGSWSRLASAAKVDALYSKTEPSLSYPVVRIDNITDDRSLLAPGYFFYAPAIHNHNRRASIIDNDGKLIWWGGGFTGHRSASSHDLQVCDWLGEKAKHLCFSDVVYNKSTPNAPHHVLDNRYVEVDYSNAIGNMPGPNQHEYNVMAGGESYLQAVYKSVTRDLSDYRGVKDGHVTDGCFQEVSSRDHKEMFRWCASEHFPLWVTYIYLNAPKGEEQVNGTLPYAGTGEKGNPWDWIHLNAVDKNEDGDYLVSARHWNSVIKVAGMNARALHKVEPGTVLWRAGGRLSDFDMDEDAEFFRQHHVRFLKTTEEETFFTVFNNAGDGPHHAKPNVADGRIVAVNHVTKKGRLVQKFSYPHNRSCDSKGSITIYPNGNVVVGWGACTDPSWSEYAADGTLLLQAAIPGAATYRVRKFEWQAQPHWDPKLVAYAPSCLHGDVSAYVSWNGATELRYWRFYVGMTLQGPWTEVKTVKKVDFETQLDFSTSRFGFPESGLTQAFTRHVLVEALDKDKNVMASVKEPLWVPDLTKLPANATCDRHGCTIPDENFAYLPELSCVHQCHLSSLWLVGALALMFVVLETLTAAGQRTMHCTIFLAQSQPQAQVYVSLPEKS